MLARRIAEATKARTADSEWNVFTKRQLAELLDDQCMLPEFRRSLHFRQILALPKYELVARVERRVS